MAASPFSLSFGCLGDGFFGDGVSSGLTGCWRLLLVGGGVMAVSRSRACWMTAGNSAENVPSIMVINM